MLITISNNLRSIVPYIQTNKFANVAMMGFSSYAMLAFLSASVLQSCTATRHMRLVTDVGDFLMKHVVAYAPSEADPTSIDNSSISCKCCLNIAELVREARFTLFKNLD